MEEKTLKIRQILRSQFSVVWLFRDRYWNRGSRERKVAVTALKSRNRTVIGKDQKTKRGSRTAKRYLSARAQWSHRLSDPPAKATLSPIIFNVMKITEEVR